MRGCRAAHGGHGAHLAHVEDDHPGGVRDGQGDGVVGVVTSMHIESRPPPIILNQSHSINPIEEYMARGNELFTAMGVEHGLSSWDVDESSQRGNAKIHQHTKNMGRVDLKVKKTRGQKLENS